MRCTLFQTSLLLFSSLIYLASVPSKFLRLIKFEFTKFRSSVSKCWISWIVKWFLLSLLFCAVVSEIIWICQNKFRKSYSNSRRSYGRAARRFTIAPASGKSSQESRWRRQRGPLQRRRRTCQAVRARSQARVAEEAGTLSEPEVTRSSREWWGSTSARLTCFAEPTTFWSCSLAVVHLKWRYVNCSAIAQTQARLSECDLSISEHATWRYCLCRSRGMCYLPDMFVCSCVLTHWSISLLVGSSHRRFPWKNLTVLVQPINSISSSALDILCWYGLSWLHSRKMHELNTNGWLSHALIMVDPLGKKNHI